MSISLISSKPNLWLNCLPDYSSLKMHLWRVNGSVLCIKEKFQLVLDLPYAISTFRLFIKEKSCSRSANAMCGAFVIPADLSHEIWPYAGNTAKFLWPIGDRIVIHRGSTVCASYKDASLRGQQYPGRNVMLVKRFHVRLRNSWWKILIWRGNHWFLLSFQRSQEGMNGTHSSTQKIAWVLLLTTPKAKPSFPSLV